MFVGRPVGPFDVVENFAGRAADQRDAGQRAGIKERVTGAAAQREQHFSGGGDGQDLSAFRFHLLRLRAFGAGGEKIEGLAFPGGAGHMVLPSGAKRAESTMPRRKVSGL